MEINNMVLGLRVMCKYNTLYELQGNRGLTPAQINEAKKVYNDTNGNCKIYAYTKFYNNAVQKMDYVWIEINVADLDKI